jgi:citrate synthase
MSGNRLQYRGYEIENKTVRSATGVPATGWYIYLNGQFVCQQPSKEFAHHWVDRQISEREAS